MRNLFRPSYGGEAPANYDRGELIVDSSMDLETNASQGLARDNVLMLRPGRCAETARIKMAQTFRSGTNDIDALDFVEMFLDDESNISLDDLNEVYVLVNFRPVITDKNWRMDCGVAGYDNTYGLPPFFPTRLRFEDYIYRIWIQQDDLASAHVDAAQNHIKNNYMRNPLASEVFNEEVANLLKRKIRSTVTRMDHLSIMFDYEGEVSSQDSEEILTRISDLYRKVVEGQKAATSPERPGGAPRIRGQPGASVLRLRARLLPAELDPDRRRRDQPVQGLARDLADPGRDLLSAQEPGRPAHAGRPEPAPAGGGEPVRSQSREPQHHGGVGAAMSRCSTKAACSGLGIP